MADPQPVTVPDVVLDLDRPRRLVFDVNAGSEIEDRSGQSLGILLQRSIRSVSVVRWLVWGMLLHDTPDLTPAEAGALLQQHWFGKGRKLGDLSPPIVEAINRSQIFGRPEDKTKNKAKPDPNAPAEAEPESAPSVSATGSTSGNPLPSVN